MVANLSRREGGTVYEATPAIDFVLGADNHLIGVAIHGDEALRPSICCISSLMVMA